MNPKRVWEVALTMLGAILLLIASNGRHPYGFYVVLRLVITVGAVYWAWRVYQVGLFRDTLLKLLKAEHLEYKELIAA